MEDKYTVKITDLILPLEQSKMNAEMVCNNLEWAETTAELLQALWEKGYSKREIPMKTIRTLFKIELINERTKEIILFYPN